ncbi:substrate-binding domain-containing protein [Desulfobacterales bacterium HSG2]|nr:substrate-binding domain-containing protein [Desulfobacterales bacterium HSG2]
MMTSTGGKFYFLKVTVFMWLCLTLLGGRVFAEEKTPVLQMATTTSTANTGILKELVPAFKKDTGILLRYMAVGTGKALDLGKKCKADVVMVHAPEAEKKYVRDGFGKDRRLVMYNDFVIIGPENDPAKVKGLSVSGAMNAVAREKQTFVSRGDNSGTNKKEISLWKAAGLALPDNESWYVRTGRGMIVTIGIAAERGGYALADRGTYVRYESRQKGKPSLVVLTEGDEILLNQYSVIAVNPDRCDKIRNDLAIRFMNWIVSENVQKLIGDFKLLGEKIYTPNAK